MKLRKLCFSILVALLTSLSILPAHAEVVTLYEDKFSDITAGTNTTTSGSNTAWDGAGRYVVISAYYAGGSVRLGTGSLMGSITITNLAMQAGILHVEVDVKGWTEVEGQLQISVASLSTNVTYTAKMADSFETKLVSFVVPYGSYAVTFATTAKRCFLDNITITEELIPPSPEAVFTVQPQSSITVDELTPVQFTISAAVNGNPTNVTYTSGLPTGASHTFSGNAFSWTPTLGQAGVYTLVFSALGSDGNTYTKDVAVTVNTLLLTAPANLAVNSVTDRTFNASWNSVGAATSGYVVDAWYGSSALDTPNSDVETFFESINKVPVQPLGWTFSGITTGYNDKNIGGITLNEVAFDTLGDMIATRLYPKAVTNLAFRIQGRLTSNSVLRVSGSADGTTWTEVGVYTSEVVDSDGIPENNIFTKAEEDLDKNLAFSEALNYRQFKFVYTKDKGNVGICNIAAMYEGAGTKFIPGWEGKATSSTSESIAGAKPDRTYYLRVGAKNATDTKYSTIRLQTLEAPTATLITVR